MAHKDIDKNAKSDILEELDDKYGISEKSLFIDSQYSKQVEKHFTQLSEFSRIKSLELTYEAAPKNLEPTKDQFRELKEAIDSIKTDVHKFNGDPFPAIIESWYKKVSLILKSKLFSDEKLISELKSFKEKVEKIRPNQPTDIGKHKQKIQTLIEKAFKEKLG